MKTQPVLCVLIFFSFDRSGGPVSKGESRLFYDITEDHAHLAVVGLGPRSKESTNVSGTNEDIDVSRQNVRSAAAVGTKLLQSAKVADILLDDLSDAEACAEGSVLSLFSFDRLKAKKKRKEIPNINLLRYLYNISRGTQLDSYRHLVCLLFNLMYSIHTLSYVIILFKQY